MSIISRTRRLVKKPLARFSGSLPYRLGQAIVMVWSHHTGIYGDSARLHLHPTAKVNNAIFNLSSGDVTIGKDAFFGSNVSLLAGTHDVNRFGTERQAAIPTFGYDIVVSEGVWVASNAVIVGPCTIGAHAVVAAASVVVQDVAPYTIVAGNPARLIRTIHATNGGGIG